MDGAAGNGQTDCRKGPAASLKSWHQASGVMCTSGRIPGAMFTAADI